MHKALIYLRVSTDKQAEKGLSIPAQKEQCLAHTKRLGYGVSENEDIFIDEGESARSEKRPEFQRMLMRCKSDDTVRAIVVYDLSRFSRDGIDYFATKAVLEKLGIKILSVSESAIGKDDANSSDWILEWMVTGFNEYRSRQDGEKISGGMRRKAKEGVYPTRAPFGYKNVREVISGDKNRAWIEVDEKEAVWVEKAFRLYATGDYSLRELTDLLSEQGFPSRTGKKPYVSFIEKMLKNKIYIGWIVWGGIENSDGKHKPIIDRILFDKAEAIREAHNLGGNRTRKHIFILRGIAYCGECGSRWTAGYHTNGRGKKYGLYDCQKAQKAQRVACSQKSAPLDDLEGQFAQIFKQVQLPTSFVEKIRNRVRAIYAQEEETYNKLAVMYASDQTKIKEQTDRLIKLYMNNGINDERYEEEKKKLDLEEIRLKENSAKVEGDLKNTIRVIETAISLANNCYRTYTKAPYELKVLMAHAFFKEIVIQDKQIVRATLNPPLDYLCAKRLQRNPLFQLANVCGPTENRTPVSALQKRCSTVKLWAHNLYIDIVLIICYIMPQIFKILKDLLMITITSDAAEKLKILVAEENKDTQIPQTAGLRLFVQGGGCSGFQYGLMIEKEPNETDEKFESNGIKIFVDPISIQYLKDAQIEFVENSTSGGFTVKNPQAKSTCGCGQSFNTE